MTNMHSWKQQARKLKSETYALYLAVQHPSVPWYAKLLAACVVAYAFSPIDLIPDFIPVVGQLDDLIIVPLGVVLVIKLIPPSVFDECRAQANEALADGKPTNYVAAVIFVVIWILLAMVGILLFTRLIDRPLDLPFLQSLFSESKQ